MLRTQARDWLRADLALRSKQLDTGTAAARVAVVRALQSWKGDANLASVRGAEALAKLPEAEREAWKTLWADVATLLK